MLKKKNMKTNFGNWQLIKTKATRRLDVLPHTTHNVVTKLRTLTHTLFSRALHAERRLSADVTTIRKV